MKNNSILADVMRRLSPLLDGGFIGMLGSSSIWNLVLGALPPEFEGIEKQLMEKNRKDTTIEKTDNIERLTSYALQVLKNKPDFGHENRELFSLALVQLMKYTAGDKEAEDSLSPLKDHYISFMTSYYIESLKCGTSRSASRNIRNFSEKFFGDYYEISKKLNAIVS